MGRMWSTDGWSRWRTIMMMIIIMITMMKDDDVALDTAILACDVLHHQGLNTMLTLQLSPTMLVHDRNMICICGNPNDHWIDCHAISCSLDRDVREVWFVMKQQVSWEMVFVRASRLRGRYVGDDVRDCNRWMWLEIKHSSMTPLSRHPQSHV